MKKIIKKVLQYLGTYPEHKEVTKQLFIPAEYITVVYAAHDAWNKDKNLMERFKFWKLIQEIFPDEDMTNDIPDVLDRTTSLVCGNILKPYILVTDTVKA